MVALLNSLAAAGCRKPGCRSEASLARHHKGHQAMWLGPWEKLTDIPRYANFIKRYYEFRPEDVVMLCLLHHAEIHKIYDVIVMKHQESIGGLGFYKYSWRQAHDLMKLLKEECNVWLTKVTPGYSPSKLDLDRARKNRRIARLQRRERNK